MVAASAIRVLCQMLCHVCIRIIDKDSQVQCQNNLLFARVVINGVPYNSISDQVQKLILG